MAEDFPEDKYNFKAQKDERTFGDNLLHVAVDYYYMINAIKGQKWGTSGTVILCGKSIRQKTDIVKYLKQAVADGADLIKAQGDSGLMREFKFPWGNMMVHGSFGWMVLSSMQANIMDNW